MSKKKAWMSWSSGKDSAMALYKTIQNDSEYEVCKLLTTVNSGADRVAMHGVRKELLILQSKMIGIEIEIVDLPWPCTNETYEELMGNIIVKAKSEGITHMIFGDLFLEDVRDYRIKQLEGSGITAVFPIWGYNTDELSIALIEQGFKAILTCVDSKQLDENFSGRHYDHSLLSDLPKNVDPCGEKGEFHTFVYEAPFFKQAIEIKKGERVNKDGFIYTDITECF